MTIKLDQIREFLGDVTFASMMSLHLLNYAIVTALGSFTGFSNIIYSGFFIIAILIWLLQGRFDFNIKWIIFFGALIIWYLADASISRISLILLCAYVGMPLFVVSNIKYHAERVLTYTMIISIVFIPGFSIMIGRSQWGIIDVDVAYSILPSIIAGFVHFAYFRSERKVKWIVYLIPLFYMVQLITKGLRGPIICIVATMILVMVFQFDEYGNLKIRKMNRMLLLVLFSLLLVIVFMDKVLDGLIDLFQALNIDAFFITKTARLLNAGDLLNGRSAIMSEAWNGFLNNPVIGNGFDSFQHHTGIMYVHNFILQSLYDGGIIYFLVLMYILVAGTYKIIKNRKKEDIALFIFLIGSGLIYSLLSQDMYNIYYLWAIVAFMLKQRVESKAKSASDDPTILIE